jgi:hypothetical protein
MDLRCQTSSGTPQSLVRAPLFATRGRLLVGSHDGRGDHQICVLPICHKIAEDLLPYSTGRPAAEPLVHALVLAVTLRKIVPMRSGTQHPKHTVEENTVVPSPSGLPSPRAQATAPRSAATAHRSTHIDQHPWKYNNKSIAPRKVYMLIPPRSVPGFLNDLESFKRAAA